MFALKTTQLKLREKAFLGQQTLNKTNKSLSKLFLASVARYN